MPHFDLLNMHMYIMLKQLSLILFYWFNLGQLICSEVFYILTLM